MTDKENLVQRLEKCGVGVFKIASEVLGSPQIESRILFFADDDYGSYIGGWSFDYDGKLLPNGGDVEQSCTGLPFGEYWDRNKLPTIADLKSFVKNF